LFPVSAVARPAAPAGPLGGTIREPSPQRERLERRPAATAKHLSIRTTEMVMKRSTAVLFTLAAALSGTGAGTACGAGEDDADAAGADITQGGGECGIFVVKDQTFVDLKTFVADPAHANDEVVQKILKPVADGKAKCPTSYTEIQKSAALQSCRLETRII